MTLRYSVPTEIHVYADSAAEALEIAANVVDAQTFGLFDDEDGGPFHIHLGTDRVSDVTEMGD